MLIRKKVLSAEYEGPFGSHRSGDELSSGDGTLVDHAGCKIKLFRGLLCAGVLD